MARAAVRPSETRRRSSSRDREDRGRVFSRRAAGELFGLALLATAALTFLALASYSASDAVFALQPVENAAGAVGATLAGSLMGAVGVASVVAVLSLGWIGTRLVLNLGMPSATSRFWVGSAALLASLTSLPLIVQALSPGSFVNISGGSLGEFLVAHEQLLFSTWGALLINVLLLAVGTLSVLGISTGTAIWALAAGATVTGDLARRGVEGSGRGLQRAGRSLVQAARSGLSQLRAGASAARLWKVRRARRRLADARNAPALVPQTIDAVASNSSSSRVAVPASFEHAAAEKLDPNGDPYIVDHDEERRAQFSPEQEAFHFEKPGLRGPYCLPDVSIFQAPPDEGRAYDRDSLLMNSRILEKKLLDFGVAGRVVRVHPGPVITMYEYSPAPGIKVNKIVNLSDDLAMALRALSVRIIAPLPGKSVVGIEVPNPDRETVYIRSLLEAEGFRNSTSRLTITMGKDIFGNCVEGDLAKMPHLLVAGATGTGKSVFLNAVLCSLLSRVTPDECRLLLIDPKLLELSIYQGIPHLIADVVTNPKRAAAALAGIVRKMEDRYQMMSALGVRNIEQFNAAVEEALAKGETSFRLKKPSGEEEGKEIEFCKMPFIVVVIDELADLMVQVARDVEESLQRLAQMARAAGIHLILATQRPSVDVLTGVIKANFPARVSFQVSSRTDSRTILDQNGADHLLGQGDMLFLPPGTSRLQRLHGPYVSEKEVSELVAFLSDQGTPEFEEGLIQLSEEAEGGGAVDEDVDEMFDKAVAIVAETRNASISYIQRRLKVGYNRAARIIEHMEREAMVGPQEGTRPREVFLPQYDDGQ